MFYYKKIENEEVIEIGTHSLIVPSNAIEITESEYNTILAELEAKWKQEEQENPPVTEIDSIISEVANSGY